MSPGFPKCGYNKKLGKIDTVMVLLKYVVGKTFAMI
jgi:hypothetical protein